MIDHARLFKRALDEGLNKTAFIPAQATGPGGAPVQPGAGAGAGAPPGAPPGGDPMAAAGGAPPPGGDPMAAAGGAPPAPPADPAAAGGAPPTDPAAAGAPPTDPMASQMDPSAPPKPISGEPVSPGAADTVMQIVERTLKAERDKGPKQPKAPAAGGAAGAPDPTSLPGPVSGQPGFDPSMMGGPLKMG